MGTAALIVSLLLGPAPEPAGASAYLRRAGGQMTGPIRYATGTIAADDATPSVRAGDIFVTSANTGATAITDLDDPYVGQVVTICGGSNVNSSTIADAGNFALNGAFTASLDSCIDLWVQADNDYIELGRTVSGGWTGTATSDLDMDDNDIVDVKYIESGTTADPADNEFIRMGYGECLAWEKQSASNPENVLCHGTGTVLGNAFLLKWDGGIEYEFGTDSLIFTDDDPHVLKSGSTEAVTIGAGYIEVGNTSAPADAGVVRMANAASVCWEASPDGTDVCMSVNSVEQFTLDNSLAISGTSKDISFTGSLNFGSGSSENINAVTAITPASVIHTVTCDGAETINTMTLQATGSFIILAHQDTECTIADDDSPTAADAINLAGAATNDVGAPGKFLILVNYGGHFEQIGEVVNE